ncbi:MAG: hypothetical protein S4CHLAM20_03170 [Chlamydiia bacterium]|nr:hypothetical protein [Chlamydiia bacterium]
MQGLNKAGIQIKLQAVLDNQAVLEEELLEWKQAQQNTIIIFKSYHGELFANGCIRKKSTCVETNNQYNYFTYNVNRIEFECVNLKHRIKWLRGYLKNFIE